MFLNGITKLRKTWNYKQGWGYSKLRCIPKYSQPKDTGTYIVYIVVVVSDLICSVVVWVYFLWERSHMFSLGASTIIFPVVLLVFVLKFVKVHWVFVYVLNGVTKLRKTWNYKQGLGYPRPRCGPKYPQTKDTDIFIYVCFRFLCKFVAYYTM